MVDLQKNITKRWIVFDKVLLMVILLIAFFAFMDAVNLQGVFALDRAYQSKFGWDDTNNIYNIYWVQIQPYIVILWYGILIIIASIWYIVTKDKSEALAIFLAPALAIYFGTQDLLYFAFSSQTLDSIGCWANMLYPVRVISQWLHETCPTKTSFLISGLIGMFLSFLVLYKLKYYQSNRRRKRK